MRGEKNVHLDLVNKQDFVERVPVLLAPSDASLQETWGLVLPALCLQGIDLDLTCLSVTLALTSILLSLVFYGRLGGQEDFTMEQ